MNSHDSQLPLTRSTETLAVRGETAERPTPAFAVDTPMPCQDSQRGETNLLFARRTHHLRVPAPNPEHAPLSSPTVVGG
jgi:hypothetical protein